MKPRSAKRKDAGTIASSSNSAHSSICIDIGLEQLQNQQTLTESKSLSSDSSDIISTDEEVDPDVDEAQFLKMFSQRQQRNARGKGPKPF